MYGFSVVSRVDKPRSESHGAENTLSLCLYCGLRTYKIDDHGGLVCPIDIQPPKE